MALSGAQVNGTPDEGDVASAAAEFPLGQPPMLPPDKAFYPFMNNSHQMHSVLEALNVLLVFPLFLVRVALLLTMFTLGYLTTKIALIGARHTLSKPFPAWRRACLWPVRLCARGVLLACGYHWIHVAGTPAPREVAPIIVCNHVTFVDPVFVFFAHLPMIVTAKENLGIPIAGVIMRALQVIAVDRSSAASRRDASGEIRRRAMCNDWANVAIFPEATTTNGRSLVSFKAGAFSPALPVQPVTVKYRYARVDPSWVVEGPPIHLLLFRLMTQWHNHMEVSYLPVLEPTAREARAPHDFALRCRNAMARVLNVGTTEHTYGDVALALEGQKLGLPATATNVEFGYFEHAFHLENKEARTLLRTWAEMDVTRRGSVTCEEMAAYLGVPNTAPVQRAFALFDARGKGTLTFREFLNGAAFVLKSKRFQDAVGATFDAFDRNADGLITPDEGPAVLCELLPGIAVPEQVEAVFSALDLSRQGAIASNDFSEYMRKHPEFLAVLLAARPSLLAAPASAVGEAGSGAVFMA